MNEPINQWEVRQWALDRAIKEVPGGTRWPLVFALADKYTKYIFTGEYDKEES